MVERDKLNHIRTVKTDLKVKSLVDSFTMLGNGCKGNNYF